MVLACATAFSDGSVPIALCLITNFVLAYIHQRLRDVSKAVPLQLEEVSALWPRACSGTRSCHTTNGQGDTTTTTRDAVGVCHGPDNPQRASGSDSTPNVFAHSCATLVPAPLPMRIQTQASVGAPAPIPKVAPMPAWTVAPTPAPM